MNEVGCCQLGRYQEDFRLYLLGRKDFPPEASVSMLIIEPSNMVAKPERLVSFPSSIKTPSAWLHGFIICGLAFRCFVGRSLEAELKAVSLASENLIKYAFLIKAEDFGDFRQICRVSSTATARGKLARTPVRKTKFDKTTG